MLGELRCTLQRWRGFVELDRIPDKFPLRAIYIDNGAHVTIRPQRHITANLQGVLRDGPLPLSQLERKGPFVGGLRCDDLGDVLSSELPRSS